MLEIGICDDLQECAETLHGLLTDYFLKKHLNARITVFSSAEELLRSDWHKFQILFLDVVMEKQNGIEAATQIRRKNPDVSLVFVSAYLDYATMGYQVKASAYLLKDQLSVTLESTMNMVLTNLQLSRDEIEIMVDGRRVPLRLHRIKYIESQGRIAVFHADTEYNTYLRFSDIETMLAEKGFLRIHRCYIVNPAHCVTIRNYQALLDNGESLPCSRQDYAGLVQRLMYWKGKNL